MNIFETLVITHLIGDWIFQTEYEAMNKMKDSFWNRALFSHCLICTLCFAPAFWSYGINWLWLLLIFGSHLFLDRRWPVVWWISTIKRTSPETVEKLYWLVIVVDQIMHVLILALIVLLS